MKYVIIGNGTAAIGCVEGIRTIDKEGKILLIASEPHHTYGRPLISYLVKGKTDKDRMNYRPLSFYADNGCETMLGRTVVKISPDKKTVTLDGGEEISYDKLMVATGSRAAKSTIPGIEKVKNKTTFITLDDADRLLSMIGPNTSALILGAGPIGLKCAESLIGKVRSITVLNRSGRLLTSILNADASDIVKRHLEKYGVKFVLNETPAEFSENSVALVSGKTLSFDVLVTAAGILPNTELISECGGKVGRGILINEKCETSLKDIYAGGDCSESFDFLKGEVRTLAILPNASFQGRTAGVNMAGGVDRFDRAIAMNATSFHGLHTITAGCYEGESYVKTDGKNYKALFYKDNVLKGFILVGDVARAGIYTSLIREATPLDTIDFELIRDHPQLMAFAHKVRKTHLGEEV